MPSFPRETARGRPGKVPIPPEHPVMPARSLIADESQRLPGPPKDVKVQDKKKKAAPKFWTFRYEGDSGPESGLSENGEVGVVAFTPIELEQPALVTLQLFEDTSVPSPTVIFQNSEPPRPFTFDAPARVSIVTDTVFNAQDPADLVDWMQPGLSIDDNGTPNPGAKVIVANYSSLSDHVYLVMHQPAMYEWIELIWDGGNTRVRYEVVSQQSGSGGAVGNHVKLFVNELESEGVAPFPADGEEITFRSSRRNEAPPNGHLYLNDDADRMYLGVEDLDGLSFNYGWALGGQLRLTWATGQALFEVTGSGFTQHNVSNPPGFMLWKELELTPLAPIGALPANGEPVTVTALEAPVVQKPNARPRARIRYTAGTSDDITILCDWRGKVQVMASRITIERLSVRAESGVYFAHRIQLSGIAALGGGTPESPLTLTEPPTTVNALGTRSLDVPPHAARVSLLMRWGLSEDDPGDAPLGQVFLAFVAQSGEAVSFTDAMSAREALFGEGLPVPAGAVALKLSNRVPDANLVLGALWHLGV